MTFFRSTSPMAMTATILAAVASMTAGAQVTSTLQSINLSAAVNQSVTLTAPTPAAQGLTLVERQINEYATPFSTTVAWDVTNSASTTVKLVVYFADPSAALQNGSSTLPSSLVEVSTDDGASWHSVTASAVGGFGSPGGSFVIYSSPVTSGGNKKSSAAVTFRVRLNLTSNPQTYAGVYTGTLNLIAICN